MAPSSPSTNRLLAPRQRADCARRQRARTANRELLRQEYPVPACEARAHFTPFSAERELLAGFGVA